MLMALDSKNLAKILLKGKELAVPVRNDDNDIGDYTEIFIVTKGKYAT